MSIATISSFYESDVQYILALFLTKSNLYEDYKTKKDKQGYFFERFRKFAADYYHFSEDERVYFGSVKKELLSESNVCGGTGKMSGASSRYFKQKFNQVEESREKEVDKFAKKYGISFEPDPRKFLGVTEIWNKLHIAQDIIAASKWSDVREKSYDDASFEMPIPEKLEKILVPFTIRNKAVQKLRNTRSIKPVRKIKEEEETTAIQPTVPVTMFIPPPELYDEDW